MTPPSGGPGGGRGGGRKPPGGGGGRKPAGAGKGGARKPTGGPRSGTPRSGAPRAGGRGRAGAAEPTSGRADTGRAERGERGASLAPRRQGAPRGLGGEQVEGRQAVRELLMAGRRRVHEVLLASDLDPAAIIDDIRELAADARVPVREVSRSKLDATAGTNAPQGVIAFAATLPEAELDDLATAAPGGPSPFLLALDGVTDPGNVGALLRTADGAGVTGVVLPRHRAVHVTPSVTKSAAGAVEHLPMALVGGMPAALSRLSDLGVWVIGFDAEADRPLWELDLGDEPVAVVLGAEGAGLSRLARARCDQVVAIPLRGSLASLNVSAAGALACFEVARRRSR